MAKCTAEYVIYIYIYIYIYIRLLRISRVAPKAKKYLCKYWLMNTN